MAGDHPALFIAKIMLVSIILYPLGVLCHEVVGHGLTGIVFGGRINRVEVLGFDVYPHVHWRGWMHRYGECDVTGVESAVGGNMVALSGSLSTWLVSIGAMARMWLSKRGRKSLILAALGLWWVDMFTYTLPSWGIPRSILWGQRDFSEPYSGAVGLGMPGWMFQALVIITSAALALAWVGLVVAGSRRIPLRPDASPEHRVPEPSPRR